jgi:predicted MFS family arabinose efflux permease
MLRPFSPPDAEDAIAKRSLLALAVGGFGLGMTEFVIMGLLPDIAHTFGVSIPQAGYLVSAYALGVVVGAPLLTVAARRFPPRRALVGLMLLFTGGSLLSAGAGSYGVLMGARVLSGFSHGSFFGVGAVVAKQLAEEGNEGQAISTMFMGLTLANVVGVPLGTGLGYALGWRAAFAAVSLVGACAVASLWRWVPALPTPPHKSVQNQLAVFKRAELWLVIGVAAIGFGGFFAAFSYIAPLMTEVAGFGEGSVSLILVLAGVGMTLGNLLGGRLADRAPVRWMGLALVGLAGALALLPLLAPHPAMAVVGVFVFALAAFTLTMPVQILVIRTAREAEMLGSAANQSAFNTGNAIGAYVGGLPIAAGLGYGASAWAGIALVVVGMGFAAAFAWRRRQRRRKQPERVRQQPERVAA